ncbi:MAG TPA: putative inorganic carbon transporter subunit DabA, partial [Luteolibacter sp.]|nr:putative inorganic carbon transporter subunit DabA [Luteolibacter sp.]
MNATINAPAATHNDLDHAITEALERIAPLWPLEHFVAVNPFMGFAGVPFADACATLRRTLGKAPVQTPGEYLAAWKKGLITADDLASASDTEWPVQRLLETLENADHMPLHHPVASFADLLDETLPHAHWSGFIAEEIAKWCAVHFDRNQTTWVSPWRHMGLFAAWRSAASHDRKPETFGLPGFRAFVCTLPDDPRKVIRRCFMKLDPQGVDTADFLHRQLANITGWAGHVRYLVREDAMRGNDNPALIELLAIRLAYDAALHRAFGHDPQIAAAWRNQTVKTGPGDLDEALARWQSAYETGFQRKLAADLTTQPSQASADRPRVQAVFCIDVRSEIVRRH